MKFKDWPIKTKLIAVGLGIPVALAGTLLLSYYLHEKDDVVDMQVDKARAIVLSAEASREQMEEKWEKGFFTTEMLKAFAEKGENDKLLMSVPIVTAWNTAMLKAKEGGYEFKTPKFSPRNQANMPDAMEARALNAMKDNGLEEYYEVDPVRNSVRYFKSIKLTESCMPCHGNPTDSNKFWGREDGKDILGVPMEGWKVGQKHGAFEVILSLEEPYQEMRTKVMLGSAIVFGGLLASIFGFFTIAGKIVTPLQRASKRMQSIAKGDLSDRENEIDQKDEVGELLKSMDNTSTELSATIRELGDATEVLLNSAEALSGNANQMSNKVVDISQRSSQVSSSAANVSEAVNSVAVNLEEMSATINEISKNCTKASVVSNDANTQSADAQQVMARLGKSAEDINTIVQVINDIAGQTNLLALNATIEAASAGEAGKGFAVVANEVKELARQSSSAAEQISSQVSKMQSDAKMSISAIEAIAKVIDEIKQISDTIAAAVEEQSATTNELAKLMSKASNSTDNITKEIQEVSQGVNEFSGGITQTSSNANELAVLAEKLKEIVSKFKL